MDASAARSGLTELRHLGPHDSAHVPALRVAISLAVPLGILLAVDRLEWSAFCAFGAFAAVYGRGTPRRTRLRMQTQAAITLVLAVTLGSTLSLVDSRSWWIVSGSTLITAATALVADQLQWRPPGGLFSLFGFAVCASAPTSSLPTVAIAAGLSTATAAFAIAVSQIGRRDAPAEAARTSSPRPPLRSARTRQLLLRFTIAPALAGSAATVADISHPYWAMVAAVSVLTAPSVRHITSRGVLRAAGTVVGLGVTALVLAVDPGPAALVVVIVVAQCGAELFVMRNYGLAAVFITPLALSMGQLVHPLPTAELLEALRGVETLIGVVVGIAVAWATGRQTNRPSPQ